MRKIIMLALVATLCVWLANARGAKGSDSRHMSMATNDDVPGDDCASHLRVMDDEFRSNVRDEETRSLPNQPLTITGEHNGGIQVTTWDQPEFSLKLCKQAAADNETEARRLLGETKITVSGSNVSISSPQSEDHHSLGTLLMVKAPRNATVNLSVHNGGVSLNGFVGTAEAHAHNGGISFKKSSGKLTAEAQNGGISINDCGGEITANVQNGGLSIDLPEHWEGKGLEANTHNGGLVVSVPRNFSGGVEIVGSEHTSIICKDAICDSAERTWDNGHRMLRLGGANPQIHATTVNGGIVVKERGYSRGEL
ncbi:MAG TPA: hypothetical protein VI488_00175 [Candidatus Angelobacter sp.]